MHGTTTGCARHLGLTVSTSCATPAAWDAFSAACGCSYRCLFHASRHLHAGRLLVWRVRRFEIFVDEGGRTRKIAQCAVAFGRSRRIFADQLQIRAEFQHLWSDAMAAVLTALGPGRYVYGSEWATEPRREDDLETLDGVALDAVRPAFLEAIDFRQWTDWEAYWSSVSANVRRNYAKHVKAESGGVVELRGVRLLRVLPQLAEIRSAALVDKEAVRFQLVSAVKSMLKWVVLLKSATSTVHAKDLRVRSFAACTVVGDNTFYLEGGARKNAVGSGWFVLMSTIREAFDRTAGQGLFVMGPVDENTLDKPEWEGLARSRRQCRVVRRPVSTVHFTYR